MSERVYGAPLLLKRQSWSLNKTSEIIDQICLFIFFRIGSAIPMSKVLTFRTSPSLKKQGPREKIWDSFTKKGQTLGQTHNILNII